MNKNVKAAVAVGAAAILLLGGGGTFALWNDQATVSAGTIESGKLTITAASEEGEWFADEALQDAIAAFGNNDTAGYAIVPGDTIYWKAPNVTVTAEGDNLNFAFVADIAAAVASAYPNLEVTVKDIEAVGGLNDDFVEVATVNGANQGTFNPNNLPVGTAIYGLDTDLAASQEYSVVLEVKFKESTSGTTDQNIDFDLSTAVELKVQQVIVP